MPIPSSVLIGTQKWNIIMRSRTDDGMLSDSNFGYTLQLENVIVIDKLASETRKKQVLMHEMLHAVRYTFGGQTVPKKSDDLEVWEHYFISLYEEALLLVLRDNPELIKYILS